MHLEYFLAGGLEGGVGLENLRDAIETAPPGGASWLHLDHATSLWYFAVADAEGRFELPGLLTHSYLLIAFDRSTGCFGGLPDVRAGSTAEITVRRNEVWPELSGRLVSRTGEPIVGARVQQKLVPFQCGVERPQGRFHWCLLRDGRRAESDADGRFVLRQVGRRATYLIVEGDEILPLRIEPEELLREPGAPIEVTYRCPIEVVLADAAEADACACEGADGTCVSLLQLHQNSSGFAYTLPLHGGRSGVFCVGEHAVRLRLLQKGVTVRLVPLSPRRGQLQLVQ